MKIHGNINHRDASPKKLEFLDLTKYLSAFNTLQIDGMLVRMKFLVLSTELGNRIGL